MHISNIYQKRNFDFDLETLVSRSRSITGVSMSKFRNFTQQRIGKTLLHVKFHRPTLSSLAYSSGIKKVLNPDNKGNCVRDVPTLDF